jgi:glycosyltransferase involved in cell wall biosynthesis
MASQDLPSLSIVLPTLNRAFYLERSLLSLFSEIENFPNTELIVVDGGSTDGTIAILNKYNAKITSWTSEPDAGAGEAVNKGIALARGEVIRLVGDDDELVPGSLSKMMTYLEERPEIDILVGHNEVFLEDEFGNLTFYEQRKLVGRIGYEAMLRFPFDGIMIPECAFFRRRAFQKWGGYDPSFRFWGYRELFLRMTRLGAKVFVLPEVIVRTYQTPLSDSIRHNGSRTWKKEYYEVLWKQGNAYWVLWHRFGGELTPLSPLKWMARLLFSRFGTSPRAELRSFLGNRNNTAL